MPEEYLNQSGERVIVGSRRPDGTFRKDVRVRSGYVPQEEQKVYQSKGAMVRKYSDNPLLDGLPLFVSLTTAVSLKDLSKDFEVSRFRLGKACPRSLAWTTEVRECR